jgi:hypothetical protein
MIDFLLKNDFVSEILSKADELGALNSFLGIIIALITLFLLIKYPIGWVHKITKYIIELYNDKVKLEIFDFNCCVPAYGNGTRFKYGGIFLNDENYLEPRYESESHFFSSNQLAHSSNFDCIKFQIENISDYDLSDVEVKFSIDNDELFSDDKFLKMLGFYKNSDVQYVDNTMMEYLNKESYPIKINYLQKNSKVTESLPSSITYAVVLSSIHEKLNGRSVNTRGFESKSEFELTGKVSGNVSRIFKRKFKEKIRTVISTKHNYYNYTVHMEVKENKSLLKVK